MHTLAIFYANCFRIRFLTPNTLQVRYMNQKDGGVYTCVATSIAGEATSDIIITVRGKYHWIIMLLL